MDLGDRFGSDRPLVGMVHLRPLPGAPRFAGDRDAVRDQALSDARVLVEGGFDAVLVENFGDAPFYPDEVPPHVVAEMTAVARGPASGVDCPLGVNVLRNDARAALSVAAATGGAFVRVNVHAGGRATGDCWRGAPTERSACASASTRTSPSSPTSVSNTPHRSLGATWLPTWRTSSSGVSRTA